MEQLKSQLDQSVNFVEQQLTGFLESRFVRKVQDYFICYLSSQTGCNRGCTFCHLTATGQTSFVDSTPEDFVRQTDHVFKHYAAQPPARYVHYNFMARGEVLANRYILSDAPGILTALWNVARVAGVPAKFNVSTIMPVTLKKSLVDIFQQFSPTIYYSLYSVNKDWRRRWLPAAHTVDDSLRMLKEYQDFSKKIVKIHYAFIEGENDSFYDVDAVIGALKKHELHCEFNVVRYNPASPEQGRESAEEIINSRVELLREHLCGKVQVIPRVGFDVKASCGMFV